MDKKLEDLKSQFANDHVTFRRGAGGFIYIDIANERGAGTVCCHGAHVTAFAPAGEEPVIWMSESSWFEDDKPIRGGIPVCWPWFGAHPTNADFPAHGFARLSEWEVKSVERLEGGADVVTLVLDPSMVNPKYAAPEFELECAVTVGRRLRVELTTTNTGTSILEVGQALHTYFNVSEAADIAITGLGDAEFLDTLNNSLNPGEASIRIAAETDRQYLSASGSVRIVDPGLKRTILVEKSGSNSTVVWNPWIAKSQRMPDFGDLEYHTMVCVEACNIKSDARRLSPGESHTLETRVGVEK